MEGKRRKLIRNVLLTEAVMVILLLAGITFLGNSKTDAARIQNESSAILKEHQITDEPVEPNPTETVTPEVDNSTEQLSSEETEASAELPGADEAESVKPSTSSGEQSASEGLLDAEEYIATLQTAQAGTLLQSAGAVDVVFYLQIDSRWADLYYGGTDTFKKYACGPTSMSIVVSSLTDIKIDPVQMAAWAYQNNYWYPESGSLHSLIPDAAAAFGLQSEGVENVPGAGDKIIQALKSGKLVVALMGKGQFTQSGHFIVLRGVTEDGKILVADPASEDRTNQSWNIETITGEAKAWAAANGPFWIISKIESQ